MTQTILNELRANVESEIEDTDNGNVVWGCVYLDNARPRGMNPHAFAGHLSALERAGLYRPIVDDGCFGDVLVD